MHLIHVGVATNGQNSRGHLTFRNAHAMDYEVCKSSDTSVSSSAIPESPGECGYVAILVPLLFKKNGYWSLRKHHMNIT
jgi:hypothetical protein